MSRLLRCWINALKSFLVSSFHIAKLLVSTHHVTEVMCQSSLCYLAVGKVFSNAMLQGWWVCSLDVTGL